MFIVDSDLPGITLEQLMDAQRRAVESCERSTADGIPVRHLYAIWVPEDWRVMSLFEAAGPDAVEAVSRAAQIPFLRIAEAVVLTTKHERAFI